VAADRRIHTFVVGASAGGVEALRDLVALLPPDFPAVVLVVLHLAPVGTSVLPQILQRAGALTARTAEDGGQLNGGCIYVAPPDLHLLVQDGYMHLDHGPRVNGHRPAVDNLFQSAAAAYGSGVGGVILSGVLDDGSAGLLAIKRAGGMTLVQDPDQALYDAMPRNAIEVVHPDEVGTIAQLAALMTEAAGAPDHDSPTAAKPDPSESSVIAVDRGSSDQAQPGNLTGFTCPECGGAQWEMDDERGFRVRCRTGHEYAPENFIEAQGVQVEAALWSALRSLEERAALHRRIAARYRDKSNRRLAERFAHRADQAVEQAIVIRRLLTQFDEEGVA
jgi:two-component system chemotaxis response regulator CheB